jgi:hypothetical protein
MRKFKRGDKVRVHFDTSSPYRGRTGIVQHELPQDSRGFWYMVEFQLAGVRTTSRFVERDLETTS